MPAKFLVYHYRGGRHDDPTVMTGKELDQMLNTIENGHKKYQETTKPITASVVRVLERDLRTPEQQARMESKPNSESEVASVKIPFTMRFPRQRFKELVIVSATKE